MFVSLHMAAPLLPVYIAILIVRRAIIRKLDIVKTLSETSRSMHSQLLRAITYQACLPLFFLYGTTSYLLGQLKIFNHPILEYTSYLFIGCIPMLSPMMSLYFIRPYREWISSKVLRRKSVKIVVLSATSVTLN
ncbi:hypothetical protein OESDEN_22122 [Oesophagostomum dentatum]|uniref:7TM chemoreceptor n=1 Tax=Oesophagostomum dentatum TaxID=61180 RepID=A0A0B1RYU5_OESDE|nr:hypothetical protein OESDEN_22122 [Oesophagostomum dentatum]